MKQILLMIAVMGCASTHLQEEALLGTYEAKKEGKSSRLVLLKNGEFELDKNGEKIQDVPLKWRIADGEVVVSAKLFSSDFEDAMFLLVERNGNLTLVADEIDGVRKNLPKEERVTFNKIN